MDETELEKKLRPYYDGEGRLKGYPSKRTLRPAVLGRFAEKFEPGRDYTEKEVNAVISSGIAFSDIELIRRELIESKLLSRERDGSRYWRTPVREE